MPDQTPIKPPPPNALSPEQVADRLRDVEDRVVELEIDLARLRERCRSCRR